MIEPQEPKREWHIQTSHEGRGQDMYVACDPSNCFEPMQKILKALLDEGVSYHDLIDGIQELLLRLVYEAHNAEHYNEWRASIVGDRESVGDKPRKRRTRAEMAALRADGQVPPIKHGRGRPKGSKNKPKACE